MKTKLISNRYSLVASLILALFTYTLTTFSQGVGVNSDGAVPVAGTMLDVKGASDDNTTYGLQVKDSSGNAIMAVRSDGNVGIGTTGPTSTMHVSGSSAAKVVTVTSATYTAGDETYILADATSGAITINLPAASGVADRRYFISKIDASAFAITIDGNGSETINGNATQTINSQYDSYSLICDGTEWYVYNSITGPSGSSGPAFRADRTGGAVQTVPNVTSAIINFPGEIFDTNNNFDPATDRFTPTVTGKYIITACGNFSSGSDGMAVHIAILKNGSKIGDSRSTAGTASSECPCVAVVAEANGTSDYFEAEIALSNSASSRNVMTDYRTHFSAARLDGGGGLWTDNNPDISFTTGNVGIGTTSPSTSLHVADDIAYTGALLGGELLVLENTRDQATSAMGLAFKASRNDVDGVSYWAALIRSLSVQGTGSGTYPAGYLVFQTNSGNGNLNERMRITNVGNVGIGTQTPSHLLHVNGVARSSQTTWAISSDRRVKTNIKPINHGLETILKFRPVEFEYTKEYQKNNEGYSGKKRGFIAQEVKEILPDMITVIEETYGNKTIKDFNLLNSNDFTPMLVKAIQDLSAISEEQKQIIEELKKENAQKIDKAELDELKAEMEQLKNILNQTSKE